MDNDFSRRPLIMSDAAGYSGRTDAEQPGLQQEVVGALTEAADMAGLERGRWDVQSNGDGELAVLPGDIAEWTVIDRFPSALHDVLTRVNAGRADRLRMRVAVHHGLVRRAAGGYAGNGVVTAARLVESETARNVLRACPTADLVVLLSSSLYNEVVRQRHTTALSAEDFREVTVTTKTFHDTAWLHVPGHDAHRLQLTEESEKAPAPSAPQSQITTTVEKVRGKYVSFGNQNIVG
jgi:class 3 adenylate cyclase